MPERRKLMFASLDEAVADAESLLARGYERVGKWDLARCCEHLAVWLTYPVAGYPRVPLLVRPMAWVIRTLAGRRMREKIVAGGFAAGRPTVRESVPAPGGDPAAAVAKFRDAAAKFAAHAGRLHRSPLFGAMTKDEMLRLQLRHCEHHLGFLVPGPPA